MYVADLKKKDKTQLIKEQASFHGDKTKQK